MALSDSFKDLDPQIAGPLQRITDTLREEIRAQIDGVRKEIGRLSRPGATPTAAPPETEGGLDPLAELKHAVAGIDGSASQAGILTALLEGVGRFSSRAAFILIRDDGMRCWGSLGFEDAGRSMQGEAVETPDGSAWAKIVDGAGSRALSAEECAQFCSQFEAASPEMGMLLPMSLGDRVAACLYADRLGDGSVNVTALQLLTLVAGQTLETLPMRQRSSTPTLRLAPSLAPIEAPIEAPTEAQAPEQPPAPAATPPIEPQEPPRVEAETEPEPAPKEMLTEPIEEPSEVAPPPQVGAELGAPVEVEAEPVAPPPLAPTDTPHFDTEDVPVEAPPIESLPTEPPPIEVEEPAIAVTPPVEEAPAEPQPEPPPVKAEATPAAPLGGGNRSSTQVVPPDDVLGPGWAFTTKEVAADTGNEALQEEARRLARLLVTEIKLYNEEQVEQGRRSGDIYRRLREDIDRSRQIFDDRIDDQIRAESDYFKDALVRILAGGDESLLGL